MSNTNQSRATNRQTKIFGYFTKPSNSRTKNTFLNRYEKVQFLNGIVTGIIMCSAYSLSGRQLPNPPKNVRFEEMDDKDIDSLIESYSKVEQNLSK